MSSTAAFDRLHRSVQRRLWDMRWTELRPIQVTALHHLLDDQGDCVISVPTAGGKTEAAFLPILSRIADDPGGGVRAMYIGPLKALINDQFRRVEGLCTRMEMPVHRWHGDVGDSARKRLLDHPSGILLITPESLEAMFVLRPTKMPHLFGRLAFVVIDELHAFMGTERGAQLQSQLERLCTRAGCRPVRIGLSATLGDPTLAQRWLRPTGQHAALLQDPEASREIQVKVLGFWSEKRESDEATELCAEDRDPKQEALVEVARTMLLATNGSTNLVFANAKSRIESLADTLKEEARLLSVRDEIVVHHGSLSKSVREYAEERLGSGAPVTAVCSNTLEMGIDVGRIDSVVQVSAPPSVAALVQRIGRSGRSEGAPAKLRSFFIATKTTEEDSPWRRLQLDFLQGIASIELMREKFLEPIAADRFHGSTLIQQILSHLAETGGTTAATLHAVLQRSGAFGPLNPTTFTKVLRVLGTCSLIEQMPEGDLILAPRAQRLVEHYTFYAAFKTPEEIAVFHRSERIGALPSDAIPAVGEHLILAGKRWRVVQLDWERRELVVEPARGKRPPTFGSNVGDVHPIVHRRMLSLAVGSEVPIYLDPTATEILADLRQEATRFNCFESRIHAGGAGTLLFLWAGKRVARTVYLALRARDLEVYDTEVGIDAAAGLDTIVAALSAFLAAPDDPIRLAERAERELGARLLEGEKYDEFVPHDLWRSAYASERLDIEGAVRTIGDCLHSCTIGGASEHGSQPNKKAEANQ